MALRCSLARGNLLQPGLATGQHGQPWLARTMATAYSSGSSGERKVITTDLHNGCTASHIGTSASAPMAAGVLALVLEAIPALTWRATDWRVNAVGRYYSHSFGYGMMDPPRSSRTGGGGRGKEWKLTWSIVSGGWWPRVGTLWGHGRITG